jgi:hypothetical protein
VRRRGYWQARKLRQSTAKQQFGCPDGESEDRSNTEQVDP